jgi:hypothetical protein
VWHSILATDFTCKAAIIDRGIPAATGGGFTGKLH